MRECYYVRLGCQLFICAYIILLKFCLLFNWPLSVYLDTQLFQTFKKGNKRGKNRATRIGFVGRALTLPSLVQFWHSRVSRLDRLVNTFCLNNRLFSHHFFRPLHHSPCFFFVSIKTALSSRVISTRPISCFNPKRFYQTKKCTSKTRVHTSRDGYDATLRLPQTHLIMFSVVSVYQVKSTESVIGFVGLSSALAVAVCAGSRPIVLHPRKRSLVLIALYNLV